MSSARRVTHEYTQTNDAPPEIVFPMLCPVREADWVPGWQYKMIYSKSGMAEAGCVFTTPNGWHGDYLACDPVRSSDVPHCVQLGETGTSGSSNRYFSQQESRGQHHCSHSLHLYRLVSYREPGSRTL